MTAALPCPAAVETAVDSASFGELLGVLTYSPVLLLSAKEVEDAATLRAAARAAWEASQEWEREAWERLAMEVYRGQAPGILSGFVARLAVCVMRVFGVSA